MSRYYFDVHDSRGSHRDEVGEDLDGFEDAREQCQAILADVIREELPDGDLHTVSCDVRDETGPVVYRGRVTYQGERDPG